MPPFAFKEVSGHYDCSCALSQHGMVGQMQWRRDQGTRHRGPRRVINLGNDIPLHAHASTAPDHAKAYIEIRSRTYAPAWLARPVSEWRRMICPLLTERVWKVLEYGNCRLKGRTSGDLVKSAFNPFNADHTTYVAHELF